MDPYPSTQPIIDAMMGMTIALLMMVVPFGIILESQATNYDTQTRSQRQVPGV